MILVDNAPLAVSQWHASLLHRAPRPEEKGLVVRVGLRFETWLGGQEVAADAFIDPRADATIVSWRWAALALASTGWKQALDVEHGALRERMFVVLGGRPLEVPRRHNGPEIRPQSAGVPRAGDMPGFEDILIGRDFLVAHHLYLVIDGEGPAFSIVCPCDEANVRKREAARAALRRDEEPA